MPQGTGPRRPVQPTGVDMFLDGLRNTHTNAEFLTQITKTTQWQRFQRRQSVTTSQANPTPTSAIRHVSVCLKWTIEPGPPRCSRQTRAFAECAISGMTGCWLQQGGVGSGMSTTEEDDAPRAESRGFPPGAQSLPRAPDRCQDDGMADILPFHRKRTPMPDREPEPLWREVLGRSLRAAREEQGGRLVDIAERAGISPQYLSEIERGRKEPSSEMIAAVTGALGVDLADLLAGIAVTVRRRRGAGLAVGRRPAGPVLMAA